MVVDSIGMATFLVVAAEEQAVMVVEGMVEAATVVEDFVRMMGYT